MKIEMHGTVKNVIKKHDGHRVLVEDDDLGSCMVFIVPISDDFPKVGNHVYYVSEARPDDFYFDRYLTLNFMKLERKPL